MSNVFETINLPDKNYKKLLKFCKDNISLFPSPGQMLTLKLLGSQPSLMNLVNQE